ncbi:MAG: MarR family winged helix-turn-helix transcriptional regulator [Sphingomicrobium sp.]
MSREQKIVPTEVSVAKNCQPDDLRLQIDIRLQVDGVAEASATADKSGSVPSVAELSQLASGIYQARRSRDKLLHGELFGEPAWDMMLALYCLPAAGERLSVTALSYAANVPQTTGLRVQAALTERGLIDKRPEPSDRRVHLVHLTAKGRAWLENYLASLLCSKLPVQSYLSLARA